MRIIEIPVEKNEEKTFPFIWTGDVDEEITIKAELYGDNASLTILGIFLGTSTKGIVINTEVIHKGAHTTSKTIFRAVLLDRSVFLNDGMVRILKGAKNTNGFFDSKILLFDDARGRSIPSLEIDENEVKAGHASTIGRPDESQLFYLRSRGLSEKEAERLIIHGFFDPIVMLLPKEDRKSVESKINDQLKSV